MLVANVEVRFRGRTSPILICLPFSVLDQFFATSSNVRVRRPDSLDGEAAGDQRGIETSLRRATLPVAVRLPRFELSLKEVTELRPGGTLITGVPRNAPVEVKIGGRTRYTGFVGTVNQALAVQIMDEVDPDEGEYND